MDAVRRISGFAGRWFAVIVLAPELIEKPWAGREAATTRARCRSRVAR